MPALRPILNQLALMATIGAVFGWIGPYGTFDLALGQRLAFWVSAISLIGLIAHPLFGWVARMDALAGWRVPARALLGTVLVSVPATGVVVVLHAIFGMDRPHAPSGLLQAYLSTVVLCALIGVPLSLIRARSGPVNPSEPAPAAEPAASPFLRRVPARLGTDLLWISAEDHYLRVTTSAGSDLILMRLSDAVAELDPALGAQVHRSHWVARRAVAAVERDGQRTVLRLVTGAEVPVSRTYLAALRAAGWLAPPDQPASTRTSSASSTPTISTSDRPAMAAPSRAATRMPPTSTVPRAGTR